ncbi:MAG TPA: hypothetical protein VEV41_21000 [Terriglobales bacterium]|nr:hypothetical protein [Terriglobales bacterium]
MPSLLKRQAPVPGVLTVRGSDIRRFLQEASDNDLRLLTEVAGSIAPSTVKDTKILLSTGTEMILRVNGR